MLLLVSLLSAVVGELTYPYVSFDGMFNNPSHPDWGVANKPISHPMRPVYEDGANTPVGLTSAREISVALFSRAGRWTKPSTTLTALVPYFGQLINNDIIDLSSGACPPEEMMIKISINDSVYQHEFDRLWMPVDRVKYLRDSGQWPDYPRVQLNSATAWLDASPIYGVSKGWNDMLRLGKHGLLSSYMGNPTENEWGLPLQNPLQPHTHHYNNIRKLHLFGSSVANENPALYSLHWLFFKEHNRQAHAIRQSSEFKSDKLLFDKARFTVIALIQQVTLYDWLPLVTGKPTPLYTGYNPAIDPSVSFLYAGAARFYLYTLFPEQVSMSDSQCSSTNDTIRLCNTYWDGQAVGTKFSPLALLTGLTYQPASSSDLEIAEDLQDYYWGPKHWSRRDLIAIAIQRGRDMGVPPLNDVLQSFEMERMSWGNWSDHFNDPAMLSTLKTLYKHDVDKVELFVGGMLLGKEGVISPIFAEIIQQQFLALRDADRFWFENEDNGLNCTADQVEKVRGTTLADILSNNGVHLGLQTDVFQLADAKCLYTHSNTLPDCVGEMTMSYEYNTTPYAMPLLIPIVFIVGGCVIAILAFIVRANRTKVKSGTRERKDLEESRYGVVSELQTSNGDREVEIDLNKAAGRLYVRYNNKVVRTLNWKSVSSGPIPITRCSNNNRLLLILVPKEYDILLRFDSPESRERFVADLLHFSNDIGTTVTEHTLTLKQLLKIARTETHRAQLVEEFLSAIFSQSMKNDLGVTDDAENNESKEPVDKAIVGVRDNVLECELTRAEFAQTMGLKPEQEFVDKIFPLVDRDNNGRVSFREFLRFMVLYSSGSADDKLRLIFNMYDVDKSDSLHVDEIKEMIRSMLEMVAASIDIKEVDDLISSLFRGAGFEDKEELTFEEFTKVMRGYEQDLENAKLGVHNNYQGANLRMAEKNKKSLVVRRENAIDKRFKRYVENNRLEIFWSVLFLLIVAALFFERFFTYLTYKEHTGFPQLLGYALPITRGSAAVMMFTFPLFLVAMCKNTITHLRGTFLKRFIPFDSNRTAHMLIGIITMVFVVMHCIGHGYNFYQISRLSPQHLSCLMPKTWLDGQGYATITTLLFGTITGITGILLVLLLLIMYIFATEYARQHVFALFWKAHRLYPLIFALMVLHGAGRILQPPTFWMYLIGPAILFTFDKLISISRKKVEIPLLEANILPSEVTNIVFKRPADFHYLAGQYANIAIVGCERAEYHPFTLTSAPHEDFLSCHIRTQKGWTKILREMCIRNEKNPERNPNLYIDGPFGEAHQDYLNYEVVVLVGGGIGVTPFASILKDLVHRSKHSNVNKVKKVYFLWASRSQRQFEWLLDIIGNCEKEDDKNLLDTHIFITKFYQKLDLRTTMLYICERHFQGISNRSLFTGLKAITHFGRPDFEKIFTGISEEHPSVRKIGVFVCGPPAMGDSVKQSCSKFTGRQSFISYTDSF